MTPESLLLHYYSKRPGLWPLVVGVLKSMASRYYGITQLSMELVASRHEGTCDHEVRTGACSCSLLLRAVRRLYQLLTMSSRVC